MLVISRRSGETIQIGPDISIKIGDIVHGKVKVLIEAPLSVPIYRKELLDRTGGKVLKPLPPALRPGNNAGASNHEPGR